MSSMPTVPFVLPALPARVHFVGIGGIGMSGLARILLAWGFGVSGSDSLESEQTKLLHSEGIPVNIGHTDVDRAADAQLVVMTAAVRPGNLEVVAARSAGVPVVKRAELLGLLANARTCVAVAGSHGKSTTSGMIVSALTTLGAGPSYAVGAVVAATGTNAAPGTGPAMVVEADEYDYSFLQLTPDIAIVINIDYDHPDLFPDQATYDLAFARFVQRIRLGGTLIAAGDDEGVRRLITLLSDQIQYRVITFGESTGLDWTMHPGQLGWQVTSPVGSAFTLDLQVPGKHNVRNAVAALIALTALGYDTRLACDALSHYQGIGRRFDVKGEANGIVVVDDYAHHPAEIRATMQAARERYPDRRIIAAFQPHTYSRTLALLDDFAGALCDADLAVILAIYASRETDTLGVTSADVIAKMPAGAIAGGSPDNVVEVLTAITRTGDVILTIGAGDVTGVGPRLLQALAARGADCNG